MMLVAVSLCFRIFRHRVDTEVPKWKFNPRSKWLEGAGNRKGVCTKARHMKQHSNTQH